MVLITTGLEHCGARVNLKISIITYLSFCFSLAWPFLDLLSMYLLTMFETCLYIGVGICVASMYPAVKKSAVLHILLNDKSDIWREDCSIKCTIVLESVARFWCIDTCFEYTKIVWEVANLVKHYAFSPHTKLIRWLIRYHIYV